MIRRFFLIICFFTLPFFCFSMNQFRVPAAETLAARMSERGFAPFTQGTDLLETLADQEVTVFTIVTAIDRLGACFKKRLQSSNMSQDKKKLFLKNLAENKRDLLYVFRPERFDSLQEFKKQIYMNTLLS